MFFCVNNLVVKYYFPSSSGVSVYSDGQVTTAIIDNHGRKRVGSAKTKNKIIFWNFFLLRGLQYFFCGLIAQFNAFVLTEKMHTDLSEDKLLKKVSEKLNIATRYVQLITASICGLIIGFLVFDLLPTYLAGLIYEEGGVVQGLIIGLIKVAMIFITFLFLRFMPFMQGLYKFNGGCNQIINSGEKSTQISKFSPHYSLNYLNFLVFSLLLSTFVIHLTSISVNFYMNAIYNFLILLGCISISYEILWAISVTKQRWLKDFVILTSFLVAIKPNLSQEEIVRTTLIENTSFKGMEEVEQDKIPMSALLAEMQTRLVQADRYEKSDVDWIIATVLNKNRAEVKLVRAVSPKEYREIMRATERRAKGEPLSSIFGFVDFYGLRIEINKKVLSPRMETELLVEEVIKQAKNFKKPEICDLCTGSGAIAIALAKNVEGKICGIDISKSALQVAELNVKKQEAKVELIESNLFDNLKKNKKFDIIVSNPPYIPSKEIEKLAVEVRKFDPRLALDGGDDGLDFYRKIVLASVTRLNRQGYLYFEVGKGQADKVRKLMKESGFIDTKIIKDYNGIERIVYGKIG